MLNFQRGPGPRNYFSRREQVRLLLLVMTLGLVIFLAREARKPEHFAWLWVGDRNAEPQAVTEPSQDSQPNSIAPAIATAAPTRETGETNETGIASDTSDDYFPGVEPELLDTIQDDSPFVGKEQQAWFHLLDLLRRTDDATLAAAAEERVTYVQLFRQSKAYRGRLVALQGVVRRAHRIPAPKNELDFEHYYQLWIAPADDPTNPVVVYCLTMPRGFPLGMQLEEEARLVGFSFKRWVYTAQDKLRTAPVVLARRLAWHAPGEASESSDPLSASPPMADAKETQEFSRDDSAVSSADVLKRKLAGPGELWALLGIDQSQFDRLHDGVPWREGENEILLKMMLRAQDFRPVEIEAWVRDDFGPDILPKESNAMRGEVFRLRGRVVRIEPIRPLAEVRERFGLHEYYRCTFLIEDDRQPAEIPSAVIFTQTVPSRWKRGVPIDERASALGFFLKFAGRASDGTEEGDAKSKEGDVEPVFVARRIAWHADTPLGHLGMDVGLLDDLRPASARDGNGLPADTKPERKLRDMQLTLRNRECFYQMLAAAGRTGPGQLIREAEASLGRRGVERTSIVPLFNAPGTLHGHLMVLSGTAREVLRIRVDDPDVRTRLGIDHYYQISLFTDDSQSNPIMFCVRELPEGIPTGKGPRFKESVTVAGFFFNTWAYRSQSPPESADSTDTSDADFQWQLAPLLIGRDIRWHPQPPPSSGFTIPGVLGSILVALILLTLWYTLHRAARGDRQFHDRMVAKYQTGPADISFDVDGQTSETSEPPEAPDSDGPRSAGT